MKRPTVSELPIEARAALRDIIAICLKAQGVGQDMPETMAVESVIELIEAGLARSLGTTRTGETHFRIAILSKRGGNNQTEEKGSYSRMERCGACPHSARRTRLPGRASAAALGEGFLHRSKIQAALGKQR